jgi:hypothetical protein
MLYNKHKRKTKSLLPLIIWIIVAYLLVGSIDSDASVTCKTDGRGVTYCFDSSTGKGWYIRPSLTGTRVGK